MRTPLAPRRAAASRARTGTPDRRALPGAALAALLLAALASPAVPGRAAAQAPDVAAFQALEARSIGPAGMSGRIAAIDAVIGQVEAAAPDFEATIPRVVYAGTATGGVWKSTDGGVTWTPIFDDQPASSIGAVAVFQPNPDIVWVGTGEGNPRNSAGVGNGIYRSVDGGRTWIRLGLEKSERIHRILLHPTDPDIAYVAALGPTWSDGEERGVFKTTDGGRTWRRVLYANQSTGAADLVMDPVNPDKLLAAMWDHRRWPWFFRSGGPGSGLHVTHDGGETWRKLTDEDGLPAGELGRIGLAIARSNPNVVYALVEAKKSELLRSDDGGLSWRTVNASPGVANRPFYYADLRVDPQNENRVYSLHSRLTVSEDGGKSFQSVRSNIHPDHHELWIHPADGRVLINGNDGGVYFSVDRGGSWRFVETLPLAQFYHINVDMETPFNVYGGLQDNGSWRGPSSLWENGGIRNYHWQEVGFGDGFATLKDPNDPRYGYSMSQGGNLMRFDLRTGERKSIRPAHPDGVELRFNWNAGIAIDPFDGSLYYGSQFVHRSTDRGDTWTIISPDLTTNDPAKQRQEESGGLTLDVTAAENHTTIMTIAPSPVERGVIWVGTDDGNVQLTRDGGTTWTNVVGNIRGVPEATWVAHVEASRHDAATAYVVFDDHRRGNWTTYVYRTTDYGRSWTSLATPAVQGFAHAIEEDPVEPRLLWLGTEFGLFVSLDAGRSWTKWTHGVPTVPVTALVVHPRDHDLVIGTHGRAAYVLDDVRPLRALAADPSLLGKDVHLFEPPAAIQYRVKQVDGYRFPADGMFQGENRPYGVLLTYAVAEGSDSAKAKIEVLDGAGKVVRTFDGPAKPGLNRAAWDLRLEPFRRPRGDDDDEGRRWRGGGPEALPGQYTIRVKANGGEATAAVEVLADPRFDIPMAVRQQKFDAIQRAGRNQERAADAIDRLRAAGTGVEAVLDVLRPRSDSTARELKAAANDLRKKLEAAAVPFTGPRDVQGIADRSEAALAVLGGAMSMLGSSWDAPTEAQLLYLAQAEAKLDAAIAEADRVLSEDVEAFRLRVEEAGIGFFPEPALKASPEGGS